MKVFSLIFPPQASQAESWDKSELVFFSLNPWSQQWSAHLLRLPAQPAWPAQPAINVHYIFCVLIVSYFQQARFDILHNQPVINTLNWNSEDIIAFSHIPSIDEAMTFE